jgi:hypothetical protein
MEHVAHIEHWKISWKEYKRSIVIDKKGTRCRRSHP